MNRPMNNVSDGRLRSSGKAPWRDTERALQVAGTACAKAGGGPSSLSYAGHNAKRYFLLP